ncbi:chymotrypsin-2-like [Contarinia nasturtii]|uniref:chymotrypsin-2-like n=1 Tax=Contarinia nasturtii TaxID=265458 RepID=UPI0012D4A213|nr:chymotrypsin-2-like [Contarinia nasturtii]
MKLKLFIICCVIHSIFAIDLFGLIKNPISSIVGGENAEEEEAAKSVANYECSIQFIRYHMCAGSIISAKWILSSAHCVMEETFMLNVLVGTRNLRRGGKRHGIQKIISHENKDIALLLVKESIEFNENVQAIGLRKTEVPENAQVTLSIWGSMRYGVLFDKSVHSITLKVEPADKCRYMYKSKDVDINSKYMCTSSTAQGDCNIDTGAPLMYENKIAGVVTLTVPCYNGLPNVYTKISCVHDWIQEQTKST